MSKHRDILLDAIVSSLRIIIEQNDEIIRTINSIDDWIGSSVKELRSEKKPPTKDD